MMGDFAERFSGMHLTISSLDTAAHLDLLYLLLKILYGILYQ
jgi:hypothetical protein